MGRQRGLSQEGNPSKRGRPPSLRPSKICPVCKRPFQWRKKWADVWDAVIYCSQRCRNRRE
ncbi:MAG: DUF2256 domain-containing protein [Cyanobacteria bacterium K_DeepCast_35m_m2_023]|nr:DUF2256 domain-containing protein [Cyanobacteria bacterium K_DeepCast_35m_m2_023]